MKEVRVSLQPKEQQCPITTRDPPKSAGVTPQRVQPFPHQRSLCHPDTSRNMHSSSAPSHHHLCYLWQAVVNPVPYGWEQQNQTRANKHSSDHLWQMQTRNLSLFGDPWGFGHFRGRPKPSWFFLLRGGEDSSSWGTSQLGNRSAVMKSAHSPDFTSPSHVLPHPLLHSSLSAQRPQINERTALFLACPSAAWEHHTLLLAPVHSKQCFFTSPSSSCSVSPTRLFYFI